MPFRLIDRRLFKNMQKIKGKKTVTSFVQKIEAESIDNFGVMIIHSTFLLVIVV